MKFKTTNSKVYTNFRNYLIEMKREFTIECLPSAIAIFDVKLEPINIYETKIALNKFEIEALDK